MSQQQLRVAQPPRATSSSSSLPPLSALPSVPHTVVNNFSSRSYQELMELAEQQRKQMEANRREEERTRALQGRTHHEMADRLIALRRDVRQEESELRRHGDFGREANRVREVNAVRQRELEQARAIFAQQQQILRNAAGRVDPLRAQLEELYRRRQAAASAALLEQTRLKASGSPVTVHSPATVRPREWSSSPLVRPTVPPPPPVLKYSPSPAPPEIVRPRASVEPFQFEVSKVETTKTPEKGKTAKDEMDGRTRLDEPTALFVEKQLSPPVSDSPALSREQSPSPPKDPFPSTPSTPQPSSSSTQTSPPLEVSLAPLALPSPKNRRRNDLAGLQNEILKLEPSSEMEATRELRGGSLGPDEGKLKSGKTDLFSIRSDSIKAAKRRSWAQSTEPTTSEVDAIKRILAEEQKKGRTHISLADVFPPLQELKVERPEELKLPMEEPKEENEKREEVEKEREMTTDEDSSTKSDEESVEVQMEYKTPAVKGILRPLGMKKNGLRVAFDPLALLLDAALEGQIDVVKENASKMPDVSRSNDEGITALHNAICAGHYEIVKFLIEALADVNAQDSDGWTPLHCAASCNNLPMVRVLVEGGACVLASTLSDLETPVEKCEQDEEGYDGCLQYLCAAQHATGTLNDGIVYAAYAYAAENDDELTLRAGEPVKVLEKDGEERGWWLCERISEQKERGLAPRTYLSLYPPLKYRPEGFESFELPLEMADPERNNNTKKP